MCTSHHLLPVSGKSCLDSQGSLQLEASETGLSASALLWPRMGRRLTLPGADSHALHPLLTLLQARQAMAFRGRGPTSSTL